MHEAADDGTGTHHLIDTCFKYGFKSADIFLNKTLKSSVGEYLVDKDRVERADVMNTISILLILNSKLCIFLSPYSVDYCLKFIRCYIVY
jgi:hypothetical protein